MSGLLDWLRSRFRRPPPSPPPPPPLPGNRQALVEQMVAAHNYQRAAHGLPLLTVHPALAQAAQGQAEDNAARGVDSHVGSDGSTFVNRMQRAGYRGSQWAENAAQASVDVGVVMQLWLSSPAHRSNLLGPYWDMGVGVAQGRDGHWYWVVDFGR